MAVCFCESYFVLVVLIKVKPCLLSQSLPKTKEICPALLEYCKNTPVNIHDGDGVCDLRPQSS